MSSFRDLAISSEAYKLSIEEAHEEAIDRGARCRDCPLYGERQGPVMGQIIPNSKLVMIGEAPGPQEVEQGAPFVGKSGEIVNAALNAGGMNRTETSVTNVLLCRPPLPFELYMEQLKRLHNEEDGPLHLPTECCAPRLQRDLEEANSTVELAVGNQALQALAKHHNAAFGPVKADRGQLRFASLKKQHGAPIVVREGEKIVMSTYHPAFAMRKAYEWMPIIKLEIERAVKIALRGGALDWVEPEFNVDPTLGEIFRWLRRARRLKLEVVMDIETGPSQPGADDGIDPERNVIRCIGLGVFENEDIIVIPLHNMDGTPVWPAYWMEVLRQEICDVMDECLLIGQNLAFDTGTLLVKGYMTNREAFWNDTMIAHHDTPANDRPHDLGTIMAEFTEAPHHKDDVDHKVVDNVDYPTLKKYNGRDILGTMRVWPPLVKEMKKWGTVRQYLGTDVPLARVTRDMGMLGLPIYEPTRQAMAVDISEKIEQYLAEFQYEVIISQLEMQERYAEAKQMRVAGEQYLQFKDPEEFKLARRQSVAMKRRVVDESKWKINPNSVNDLRGWLFDDLGLIPRLNTRKFAFKPENGDDPATGADALIQIMNDLHNDTDLAAVRAMQLLLEYKAWHKLYSTYVADKKGRIKNVDWTKWGLPQSYPEWRLLQTVYKVHVIPTGRLSTQPAIQNWPAVGKENMRKLVRALPGHKIVGADYEQIELRVYAINALDKFLLKAFLEKGEDGKTMDAHSLNTATLFARTEGEIMDWYRYIMKLKKSPDEKEQKKAKYFRGIGKKFAFLEIYGGEAKKLYSTMAASRDKSTGKLDFPDLDPKQVLEWHERWHKWHPETENWQQACILSGREHGSVGVPGLDYRKRFFLGGFNSEKALPNMTIQGYAAAIANRALLGIEQRCPHRGWSQVSGLFLQIHDYIGLQAPEDRTEEASRIIDEEMYFEVENGGYVMPFPAEVLVTDTWAAQG